jgi:peptidoglycan glycosyltransferase
MLVTPLQMAMVAAGVANGGVVMKPFVVDRILEPGGSILTKTGPEEVGRAVSPETAAELSAMMARRAVGTGTWPRSRHPRRQ